MGETLPVLSLWQPWASLVVLGVKKIETRSWCAPRSIIGQTIAIHAAKKAPKEEQRVGDYAVHEMSNGAWRAVRWLGDREASQCHFTLPLGAIVATARLVDCVPILAADTKLTEAWRRHVAPTRNGDLWLWKGPSLEENRSTGRRHWLHEDITAQRPYGDFAPGRWAWLLSEVTPVDPPVPFVGGQGFSKRWERP